MSIITGMEDVIEYIKNQDQKIAKLKEENDELKKENEKIKELKHKLKLSDDNMKGAVDSFLKVANDYDTLKEKNDKEKNTLKVEIAKLKEKNDKLMKLSKAHKEHKDLLKIQIEKLKEEQKYTLDDLHELVENEGFDDDLYDEENFDVEEFIHDVKEKMDELDNEVDRLSELETIVWTEFYGEKEVIDNTKLYKFREDIHEMKKQIEKLKEQHKVELWRKGFLGWTDDWLDMNVGVDPDIDELQLLMEKDLVNHYNENIKDDDKMDDYIKKQWTELFDEVEEGEDVETCEDVGTLYENIKHFIENQ